MKPEHLKSAYGDIVDICGTEVPTVLEYPQGYTLVMTCAQCPEQYDCYNKDGAKVGYFRIRGGSFTVECPDSRAFGRADLLIEPFASGDEFHAAERDMCLALGILTVALWEACQHED